jgi:FkbM family methyltransferase
MSNFNLVFDIGSNIGNTVGYLLTRSNRVISFEPIPALAEHIKNQFAGQNVEVVQKGLSDAVETKTFYLSNMGGVLSTFESDWITKSRFTDKGRWDAQIEVQTTTLDNIIEEYGIPDFVKIDVEGYEYQVFCGLTKLLENTLFGFEWAEEMFDTTIKSIEYVSKLGYTKFAYTYGDELKQIDDLQFKSWNELDIHNNINQQRKTAWGMVYFKK